MLSGLVHVFNFRSYRDKKRFSNALNYTASEKQRFTTEKRAQSYQTTTRGVRFPGRGPTYNPGPERLSSCVTSVSGVHESPNPLPRYHFVKETAEPPCRGFFWVSPRPRTSRPSRFHYHIGQYISLTGHTARNFVAENYRSVSGGL